MKIGHQRKEGRKKGRLETFIRYKWKDRNWSRRVKD
jgi:hypothetical protein